MEVETLQKNCHLWLVQRFIGSFDKYLWMYRQGLTFLVTLKYTYINRINIWPTDIDI
jgi:hypothetical protein